jgi:hypothetical protein
VGDEWVADPRITWRILLSARPTRPAAPALLADRQAALHRLQAWPAAPPVRRATDLPALLTELSLVDSGPLVVGVAGDHLAVSAHHAHVDGLGLLDVLAALVDGPVKSSARGLAPGREPGSAAAGSLRRLGEVAFAPPAAVATSALAPADGDANVHQTVDGSVRTAALVHAGVVGVLAHNTERGVRTRHVAVAIGAGRPRPDGERIGNRSELIRLRDLEGLDAAQVAERVRAAPVDMAGGSGVIRGGRLSRTALRVLAPRLGSTLLVSHLGDVTTDQADALAFYPVTAGGSGISLGAVGHDGHTTLTLRARGSIWDGDSLAGLLDRVSSALAEA